MDRIDRFIERYRREFDFFDQAARLAHGQLDSALASSGIQAMVTYRAKRPDRLEQKLRQRDKSKTYANTQDIYDDIVDFAGVRVALYFPGAREEVDKIIQANFDIDGEPKKFPQESSTPTYEKRFSGYWATHYRVRLRDRYLQEPQKRYSDAAIEIQVASVLMHAWSEVEHDLVYKPLQGSLSEDEYAILDELNGLVLAGEIALERLQRAGELRASTHGREYANHYDLAASLLELGREHLMGAKVNEATIGKVDVLYQLLKATNINTPEKLEKFVEKLHNDFEKRPLSEQIIDKILDEDPTRYNLYLQNHILEVPNFGTGEASRKSQIQAIGEFMSLWIEYEQRIRQAAQIKGITATAAPTMRLLSQLELPHEVIASAERLRRIRNHLVHGIEVPDIESIETYSAELRALIDIALS